MYIRERGAVYMLDRDNAVFLIPHVSFPCRDKSGEHLKNTLLDGVRSSSVCGGVMEYECMRVVCYIGDGT